MSLQDMFRTMWFGKWLVLVSLLAAFAGAWMYVSRQEPQYASEATVQIVDAATLATAGIRLESDPSLVTGDAVTQAAATALGDPRLANELAAHTIANYEADGSTTIAITETGTEPDATVKRANAVAAAYVAALQRQFDDDVAGMQGRLTTLAESIDQQQEAITAAHRQSAAAAAAASPNGVTVAPVEGLLDVQYSASMDQYQTLAGQLSQAKVLAAPATILQNAVSGRLVSVPVSLVYAIAALAGLLVGIGLAVVRRGLDTKVRSTGAVRRSAGAPVLARLSGTAAALRSYEAEGTLPVARREATAYTRSVRELRTALQAAVENDSGTAVIVVTAADLETPRSFVAANLAASWALSGRSVVVLSGDLRQPRLNALLPASGEVPARGARTGGRPRSAALATSIPHLSVHPALQTELDPADFLASDEVRALVEQLRSTADVVIIDAPPMLVAADATILGSYADGVLLAVTLGHTAMVAVEESAERLRAANAALLGLSLDGVTERRQITYEATYAYVGAEPAEAEQGGGQAGASGVGVGVSGLGVSGAGVSGAGVSGAGVSGAGVSGGHGKRDVGKWDPVREGEAATATAGPSDADTPTDVAPAEAVDSGEAVAPVSAPRAAADDTRAAADADRDDAPRPAADAERENAPRPHAGTRPDATVREDAADSGPTAGDRAPVTVKSP